MFVGVGNGLPAALPHASPRLKILMAPHWCCRLTPREGYPGDRYPRKTLVPEIPGVKVQGVLVRSETKIEVRNEDWPPGCLSQGLKFRTRSCYIDRYCFTIIPRVVGIRGKLLFSRTRGRAGEWVNVFVGVGNGLPAALPHTPVLEIPGDERAMALGPKRRLAPGVPVPEA